VCKPPCLPLCCRAVPCSHRWGDRELSVPVQTAGLCTSTASPTGQTTHDPPGCGVWERFMRHLSTTIYVLYTCVFMACKICYHIYGNILLLYVIYKYVCLVIVTKTRTLALRQWTVKYSTAVQLLFPQHKRLSAIYL